MPLRFFISKPTTSQKPGYPHLVRWVLSFFPPMIAVPIILFAGCKPAAVRDQVTIEPVKVRVAPVMVQEINLPVRSAGFVTTSEEVKLSFKTGGIVARIWVREGDAIKKGQLLATLDLSEINALVNQARNGYEKALRDFNRAKNLFADSVATLEQLQNAETALDISKSIQNQAQFNLAYSKIMAPGNGVVLKQLARENELVAPGYPVFAVGIKGKKWVVRTSLSDRDIVKIQIGDSARIRIDAWPDRVFHAVVNQIDEAANSLTGTYEVELDLEQTDLRLSSGFIANVEIFPSEKVTCLMVPIEALVEADGQIGYVFVPLPGGTVKKIRVEIITLTGSMAALNGTPEDLKEVVSEGAAYLSDNLQVEIRK